jgi:molybdopterin synthase catalytic subunit
VRITVRFFAILRDRAGTPAVEIEVPAGSDVATAIETVSGRIPAVRNELKRAAFAVNRNYVKLEATLSDGDELALIPPVSGG